MSRFIECSKSEFVLTTTFPLRSDNLASRRRQDFLEAQLLPEDSARSNAIDVGRQVASVESPKPEPVQQGTKEEHTEAAGPVAAPVRARPSFRSVTRLCDLSPPAHDRDPKAFFDCVCEVC